MQHRPSCHPQSARIDSNTPTTESDDATLTETHGTTRETIPSHARRAQERGRVTNSGRVERPPRAQQRTTANERGGRRMSVKNYTPAEVEELLNAAAAVEIIGANMWATVGQRYNSWALANELPTRKHESLKMKFDKLLNTNKSTGDPLCPTAVRRSKGIGKDILGKAQAAVLGNSLSDDDDDYTSIINEQQNYVGIRQNSRSPGAAGIPRRTTRNTTEEAILDCVLKVADKFSSLSDSIVSELGNTPVLELVRKEVENAIALLTESIDHIIDILSSLKQDKAN